MRRIGLALISVALSGCVNMPESEGVTSSPSSPTVFLRVDKPQPPPTLIPAEGALTKTAEGCVVFQSREEFLVFWSEDTSFEPTQDTFRASTGSPITFGDHVRLSGTSAGPSKVTSVGGVAIPKRCLGYPVWIVAKDGITKL